MRWRVVGGLALAALGLSSVAQAQETNRWTGCYFGGHLGGASGGDVWSVNPSDPSLVGVYVKALFRPDALGNQDEKGILGGAQVGCDLQVQKHFVVGLQGDFSWENLKSSHSLTDTAAIADTLIVRSFTGNTNVDRMGSITGRLGYSSERALFYVKGGAAWVHNNYGMSFDQTFTFLSAPVHTDFAGITGSASEMRWGWIVGTGFEYALSKHVSTFVEYDFSDFGSHAVKFSCAGTSCAAPLGGALLNIDQQMQQVKLGLNVRF